MSSELDPSALKYALFLCCGQSVASHERGVSGPIVVLDQAESPDFEEQLRSEAPIERKRHNTLHIILLSPEAGSFPDDLELRPSFQVITVDVWISKADRTWVSHSLPGIESGELTKTEICYNVSESLSYVANNTSPLDSTPTISSRGPTDMVLHHQHEPLYFRLDITTGQSVYMFPQAKSDVRNLVYGLHEGLRQHNLVKWLLWIETQLHQGSLFEITDSDRFSKYVQLLHKMSRNLITLEHNNQRDASNIDHLLQDHTRLGRLSRRYNGAAHINNRFHEHVRDDLLALRDCCEDRHRRILNLRQRTNNFITLLYNLITGHDSTVNLRIATQSASIAREARKDSMSMKIIAAVTLIYLPATFVCSVFGTNLVAFDTSADSNGSQFLVSRWWWLYLAFAVPLTVLTMFGFWVWRRFRETSSEKEKRSTD
ncbi:uncharacterized protein N7511_008826 [Penicillium nucicola]|uniref:uncharacterized protein n=1 Tax=Penicillium nucicola TaxID=1850975 RepID=UPI002545ADCC|nr:uncharacterized protein N7511_008826 [Penicillium nucicola]KAJ5747130.1 hypothetical protein N7511_008826 [Penicillium nucicola]